ncbi:hypothetical protein ACRRTK_020926 [Alexandromys fortis]
MKQARNVMLLTSALLTLLPFLVMALGTEHKKLRRKTCGDNSRLPGPGFPR